MKLSLKKKMTKQAFWKKTSFSNFSLHLNYQLDIMFGEKAETQSAHMSCLCGTLGCRICPFCRRNMLQRCRLPVCMVFQGTMWYCTVLQVLKGYGRVNVMLKNLNLFRTKKQLEKQRYKTILVGEKITMTSYSREGFIFLKSREKANKSNG